MRILVTGSRTWTDEHEIALRLWHWTATQVGCDVTVVHGACPRGADAIADDYARRHGFTVERHPADWATYGKAAGFIRNAAMAKLGADVCLAFIRDGSRGASHCAAEAEKTGIPVRRLLA